ELDVVTAGSGRATADVFARLHELDAIRLGPAGGVVVAYPFSAAPTRHRVRIAGGVEVYAMCAIDALGMSAMLGEDTRITSVDVTTGHPVTVFRAGGVTRWEPAGAVVFLGVEAAGGPSVDCCCDYVNFFTGVATAQAWAAAHPQVPGQILTRAQAVDLGDQLFGHLLADS
ncbi:MAG: alkylmercury lyase family protein, partial [Pseudonocardia sp.]